MPRVINVNPVEGHTSGPSEALWYWEPYGAQIQDLVSKVAEVHSYLYREQALIGNWRNAIATVKPTHVFGCGHGSYDTFTGYRLAPIMWVNCPEDAIPKDAETVLLSCEVGRDLGPWLVQKGVKRFLGWKEVYVFWINPGVRKLIRGNERSMDTFFLKPIEDHAKRWIEGSITIDDFYRELKRYYLEEARSGKWPPDIAMSFMWDAENMVLIPPPQEPPPTPPAYVCPWCNYTTEKADDMKAHILTHLKPCWLPRLLRRLLACPLP